MIDYHYPNHCPLQVVVTSEAVAAEGAKALIIINKTFFLRREPPLLVYLMLRLSNVFRLSLLKEYKESSGSFFNKAVYTVYVSPRRPRSKTITYRQADQPTRRTDTNCNTYNDKVALSRVKTNKCCAKCIPL